MGLIEGFMEDIKATIHCTLRDTIKELIYEETTDKWMKVDELSKYWGVSKDWIYKNSDRIPHTREGGLSFLRSEVDSWRRGELKKIEIVGKSNVSITNYKSNNFKVGK